MLRIQNSSSFLTDGPFFLRLFLVDLIYFSYLPFLTLNLSLWVTSSLLERSDKLLMQAVCEILYHVAIQNGEYAGYFTILDESSLTISLHAYLFTGPPVKSH